MLLLLHLTSYFLLFPCPDSSAEASAAHLPRVVFTDREIAVKRSTIPGHQAPVKILPGEEPECVTAVGQTHMYTYDFKRPQKAPVEKRVQWQECASSRGKECGYNITVVLERQEAGQVLLCGTNGRQTLCCGANLSDASPTCIPLNKMRNIDNSIRALIIKEGEASVLVESAESADLYITYSGAGEYVGIHRFGKPRVGPANHNKEQHYVGLMLSRRTEDPLQDKVLAFYKEKKEDPDLWMSYVTQVCMADTGGPKNHLQFRWTSQMSAKLFCGNPNTRQHFSELVDVAVVHADRWQDTRVYGLFRNEWHMTAVCVYTVQDIDHIFMTSPFEGQSPADPNTRPRTCVSDSTKLPHDTLKVIDKTLEMERWVQPVKPAPLLFNHHNYTHIYLDSPPEKRNHARTVLFLTLNNGAIHKAVQRGNETFIIAEFHPLDHRAHVGSIILHPASRTLYASTRSELVQVDVENCAKYGDNCEDCVLASDPYCSWNDTHCSPVTTLNTPPSALSSEFWCNVAQLVAAHCNLYFPVWSNSQDCHSERSDTPHPPHRSACLQTRCLWATLQDEVKDNLSICRSPPQQVHDRREPGSMDSIVLRPNSKYFLSCPVLSQHAQYTWRHNGVSRPCRLKERQCLLLIDSMSPEHVGTYRCMSEELDFTKHVVQYHLQLESRAAVLQLSSPLVWVSVVAALMASLSC